MSHTKVHDESSSVTLPETETTPTKAAAYYPRPELLTLRGLYSTSKSVYGTYMPSAAAKLIGGVSKSLFKASTPVMVKVIPGSASTEWKSLENGEVDLDALLASYFTVGDETIDTFINASTDRFCQAYTNYKTLILAKADALKASVVEKVQGVHPKYESAKTEATEKFENAKTQVVEKVETAKVQLTTQVAEKYENAKSVVQTTMEDERIIAVMEQAKPYIELVKENVEPAKDVLTEMATSAQAEVTEKGYVEFAKDSAEAIRDSGLEVIETCKAKGTVEGVKDISQQVLSNVVNKLQEAKNKRSQSDEQYSSADDDESN